MASGSLLFQDLCYSSGEDSDGRENSVAGSNCGLTIGVSPRHTIDGVFGERSIGKAFPLLLWRMLSTRVPTKSSDGESMPYSERATQMFTDARHRGTHDPGDSPFPGWEVFLLSEVFSRKRTGRSPRTSATQSSIRTSGRLQANRDSALERIASPRCSRYSVLLARSSG